MLSKKFGSVGYCLGAGFLISPILFCLWPPRSLITDASRRDLLDKAKDQHGPILLFWGGADKGIPLADARSAADALKTAGKPYTHVEFSQAEHGFNWRRPSQF